MQCHHILLFVIAAVIGVAKPQLFYDSSSCYPVDFYSVYYSTAARNSSTASNATSIIRNYDSPIVFGNFQQHCSSTPNYTANANSAYAIFGSVPMVASEQSAMTVVFSKSSMALTPNCLFKITGPSDLVFRLQFSMASSTLCGSSASSGVRRWSSQNTVTVKVWDGDVTAQDVNTRSTNLMLSAPSLKVGNYCASFDLLSATNHITVALQYTTAPGAVVILPNSDVNFTLVITPVDPNSFSSKDAVMSFLQSVGFYVLIALIVVLIAVSILLRCFYYPNRRAVRRYCNSRCACCFLISFDRSSVFSSEFSVAGGQVRPSPMAVAMSNYTQPRPSTVDDELNEQLAIYSKATAAKTASKNKPKDSEPLERPEEIAAPISDPNAIQDDEKN